MKGLPRALDERFFAHRLRSSSAGGIAGGVLAGALFLYRLYADHRWAWDLLAVLRMMVVVKLAFMAWYYLTE